MPARHGLVICRCSVTSSKDSCHFVYPDYENGSLDGQVSARICGTMKPRPGRLTNSTARTDLVLLIRRTVRPRGYASDLHSLRPCSRNGASRRAGVGRVRSLAFLSILRGHLSMSLGQRIDSEGNSR